jgi:LysR family transcriptional regulator, transcriptional activator of the cysJI operon
MDDKLIKFMRLVDVGNYTRAARDLHISQPALSLAIQKLESELGSKLIVRDNRQLELTAAGRAVYRAARQHQNVQDDLQQKLGRLAGHKPHVRLGMIDSLAANICTTTAFDLLDSQAHVMVVVDNSRNLLRGVQDKTIDIAFAVDDGLSHDNIYKKPLPCERLIVVCRPDQLAETENNIIQGKLDNFISYDKSSTTSKLIHQELGKLGIQPIASLYSTSPDVILQMALRGKGVAALPELLVRAQIAKQELREIRVGEIPIHIARPICTLQLRGVRTATCLANFVRGFEIAK